MDKLIDYLLGRWRHGKAKGQRRVVFQAPPPGIIGDCWIWTGATSPGTDGVFYAKGKIPGSVGDTVHVRGEILRRKNDWLDLVGIDGIYATCSHPLCCRPEHIEIGERGKLRAVA